MLGWDRSFDHLVQGSSKYYRRFWLTHLRKPKDILTIISLRIDLDMWPTTQSLPIELDEIALKDCLRCSIAPGSNRKVKDLKFKLLHGLYIRTWEARLCPHCSAADSVEHRFLMCPFAVVTARRIGISYPEYMSLTTPMRLLAPRLIASCCTLVPPLPSPPQ